MFAQTQFLLDLGIVQFLMLKALHILTVWLLHKMEEISLHVYIIIPDIVYHIVTKCYT